MIPHLLCLTYLHFNLAYTIVVCIILIYEAFKICENKLVIGQNCQSREEVQRLFVLWIPPVTMECPAKAYCRFETPDDAVVL